MLDSLFDVFNRIVLLDTETTGFNPKNEEIIELAAICIKKENGKINDTERMDDFIRLSSGKRLPPEITKLTGITEAQLKSEGREKHIVAAHFCEMLSQSETLLVAYNAQFDFNFIFYFLHREGMSSALKNVKMLDALTVYRDRRPYPHKLCDAIEQYSLPTQNTHRAIDDAQATLELMYAMDAECSDLEKYINLFGYLPKYGVAGKRISSVKYEPQGYNSTKKLYE